MNMLLKSLTLVCLVGCVLAQNTTVHPCDVLIPRGSSGFANDPSGCSRYYSCNFGVFTSVSCPLGFHFAEDIQSCIPEKYSECRVCSGNGTSQEIDERSCRHWILCVNGVAIPQECDAGTFYNPDVRGCVISSSFTCTLDLCGGANDGFIANPTNCSTFYLCIGERTKRTYTCQTGLQFDHISRRCTLTPRCYPGSSSVVIVTP